MKFPISLATLATSTVALAYCVPPLTLPTTPEGQEIFSNDLKIPGPNYLQYCSSEFEEGPILLTDVIINPSIPLLTQMNYVDMSGFLGVPLSHGAKFRIYDILTGRDLSESVDLFKYMNSIGVEVPTKVGHFHLSFPFKPQFPKYYSFQIGIELYNSEGTKLLCVQTPVQFV